MPQHNETWKEIDPARALRLRDARLEVHHAAQLATAFAISYLAKKPDDSHTNLTWIENEGVLVSNASNGSRVGIRIRDLSVEFGSERMYLRGRTVADAESKLREWLTDAGFSAHRLTLEKHYEIPKHRVGDGAEFDATDADLGQLARWFSNGASILEVVRGEHPTASEVRCWPHHFDIATLITLDGGRSVGVGLEPGDTYYEEPYFYVNMHPSPQADELPAALEGGGQWHTDEWIGAVLPASRMDSPNQETQARAFLKSAITTAFDLVTAR